MQSTIYFGHLEMVAQNCVFWYLITTAHTSVLVQYIFGSFSIAIKFAFVMNASGSNPGAERTFLFQTEHRVEAN